MTTKEQFASELKAWRTHTGLSQNQAAKALNMDCTETFRSWEQGRCLPPAHVQFLVRQFISQNSTIKQNE